mmetsp:Transcript_12474/g.22655  ORF Transcript_12474/g.22655 Transcript_12474/m.22655 type:complete len:348 (-) Transcript_12474:277-1320(-)
MRQDAVSGIEVENRYQITVLIRCYQIPSRLIERKVPRCAASRVKESNTRQHSSFLPKDLEDRNRVVAAVRHQDVIASRVNRYAPTRVVHGRKSVGNCGYRLNLLQARTVSPCVYVFYSFGVELKDGDTARHFVDEVGHVELFVEFYIPWTVRAASGGVGLDLALMRQRPCFLIEMVLMYTVLAQVGYVRCSAHIRVEDDRMRVRRGLTLSSRVGVVQAVLALFSRFRGGLRLSRRIASVELGFYQFHVVDWFAVGERESAESRVPVIDEQHVVFLSIDSQIARRCASSILLRDFGKSSVFYVERVGVHQSILVDRFRRCVHQVLRRMEARERRVENPLLDAEQSESA